MIYRVDYNQHTSGCHPETCTCNPYKVIDSKGETIVTCFNLKIANKLVKELNGETK